MKPLKKLSFSILISFLISFTFAQNLKENSGNKDIIYKNPDIDIETRINDLISRMTIDDKLAQLCYETDTVEYADYSIGFFGFMTNHLSPSDAAREYNTFQKYMVEKTRLGIPAFRSGEAIYAYMGNGSTSFPQPIAQAASFNPDLVSQISAALAKELGSRGIKLVYSPVVFF